MAVALAIWVLCNSIKYQRHTAIVVNVIVSSSIQTLLNSIAQRFIPSLASTATEPSSVRKRCSSSIRSLRNTATAVNAIGSLSIGQHLRSPIHATQFHCCDCDWDFVDKQALHQHLADKIHEPRTKPKVSSFRISNQVCEQCEREFRDEKGLEKHRLSVVHNPLSYIKCIGDKRCKKQFTSPSAWLHHLESGACPSKITREKLHSAVQSNDINRLITGGSMQEYTALIGPDVSRSTSITESIIFTPMTDDSFGGFPSPPHTWEPQSGMLTPNSGSFPSSLDGLSLPMCLTCPLCPFGRKPFKSLEALKNHLSSPAHSPKVFHCPLYFAGLENDRKISQLIKYFSILSGLMQYLESGVCQEVNVTFRKTVEYIEHNLGKVGLRKLRLLNQYARLDLVFMNNL